MALALALVLALALALALALVLDADLGQSIDREDGSHEGPAVWQGLADGGREPPVSDR